MSDTKGLGQYKLFHVTEMNEIPTTEEVRTLLTPGEPTGAGTKQDTLIETETDSDYDDKYLGPVGTTIDYDQLEQTQLDTGVRPETKQAEITAYNNSKVGAASD
ncbi:hypothetical protein [Candidatus Nanohalovita haloferacivicina]|uniref:hypothetical protein n=1 Tax=Candidatus Nanohalovita haloferacivicina TaxID=2978046 RepID=UPI00325FB94F|nr:hypothetical protein HBNXNv_0638 [Candidatus Nanohalobia archaeon BNXNv]